MCITFLEITQKVLVKDMFHRLELITEILSFYKYSVKEKQQLSFFNIPETLPEYQHKKHVLGTFWGI